MKKATVSCPRCQFDNTADTFFCGKCGTKLGIKETPQFSHTMTMMTPAPELQRGKMFAGRYEIIEELGRGGMGGVYRVEDKKVNEEIALKLINPEIAQDRKIIERFGHELKVARQISHRNVCRMYDLGESEQSKYPQVTTFERLRDLLRQMGKEDVKVIDGDLGFELCRQDNVEALVLGSYVKAGETFATDVKIFDVKSRKMLKSFTAQGIGAQSILDKQIALLSREISRGVGISKRAVEETKAQITLVPTSSMEAYKYYLEGREQNEKQYYEEARKNYEKAVEFDPAFAIPYLWLSQLIVGGDYRKPDEALKKAKELSAKAPEKDRLYIEAEYARRIEKDSEKRFRILQEIATRYPKEKDTHHILALYYQGRKMYPEAIAEAEKGLALEPKSPPFLNTLGFICADAGDLAKAEEIFKQAIAVEPGDANPLDSLGEFYYRTGRLDEAIDAYKQAVKIKPDFSSDERIAYIQAVKGNYREAQSSIDQFILMAPGQGGKGQGYWWKAVFNHLSGRRDQAKTEMERFKGFAESAGFKTGVALAQEGQSLLSFDRGEYDYEFSARPGCRAACV